MEDQNQEKGVEKTMEHYVQSNPNAQRSAIVRPEVPSNFEIKPQILSMIQNNYQFGGLSNEDPNEHIEKFLEICDTFRFKDVINEAVWLRIFPFTLRDRAKSWYHTLPPESIRTWEELQRKFLGRYFPLAKTIKLRNAISNFMPEHDEQLYEAWERFKELLRKCPNHGIPLRTQIETFYNGIIVSTRNLIDAAAGGTVNKKTPNEAYELIEDMSSNMYQYLVERSTRGRVAGIHNIDPILALQAQVESLTNQLSKLHAPSLVAQICDMCGGGHPNHECLAGPMIHTAALTILVGGVTPIFHGKNNQQPNTQQPIVQTRPPPGFQKAAREPEQKANLEDKISKILANQEKGDSRFQAQEASLRTQEASIQNLEIQMGQLANGISGRYKGNLPSNSETNPKEQMRSGTVLEEKKQPQVEEDKPDQQLDNEKEEQDEGKREHAQQKVMMKDSLERCLTQSCTKEDDDPLLQQEVTQLEAEGNKEEDEGAEIKDPSKIELKPLPNYLKYVYLENDSKPVIISSCLNSREEKLLIKMLSKHKKAIGWTISDIKGISPTTCMHKILMEDTFKPTIQPQRRLNPTLQEVVKKEVLKLLDAGIIYPILDSKWVSPVQVVPKKGGMTVIKNANNELIPTRTVTGWRVCIDYKKLNSATRKDHFPLPFIDQMLERLAGNKFYCFLDGYSGYF
ncbi:hypothetical protein H6P81_016219 [Aristolochia fimbriata]|uniref:Retrotransposon gag domain-containing protein n=1 Tax=Aristolochia fimbriata TaxID=158543 RepID=A0AAV7E9E4_ARIFI|nr:hypothetical protein H6P81_016219 [Aristolochia fimbriata]